MLYFIIYTLNYFQETDPKKELKVVEHKSKLIRRVPICLPPEMQGG